MALDNNTVFNYTDKTTIKNWFKTGLKPTQNQFWSTWDSFWHKSESLPISSISGLGNLLDGKAETEHTHTEYATNDAASLTAQNITQWQNKLGINDLDYIVIPTEDATVESHPYVVVINDKGESAKRNATDFGKVDTIDGIEADENKDVKLGAVRKSDSNVVNSGFELTSENGSVAMSVSDDGYLYFKGNVTYQMTAGEVVDIKQGYGLISNTDYTTIDPTNKLIYAQRKYVDAIQIKPTNWTNPSQRFSALPNKSADATYNLFPVFDSNKNLAYTDNPYQMMKNGLSLMSAAQALELGHLLGGGSGDAGAMSINMISPPIIQNRFDSVEYVYLRGANLKLNATQRKIELINVVTNNSVLIIPDNQIISENSTELVFYYNFKDFTIGEYKIRITSGAKIYTTDWTIKVVQEVQNIDFNAITWDIKYNSGVIPNENDYGNSSVISVTTPIDTNNRIVNTSKSSELFAEGENFYIELKVDLDSQWIEKNNTTISRIGLCYSNSDNSFVNLLLCSLGWSKQWDIRLNIFNNQTQIYYQRYTPLTFTVVFIKTGNLFRTIINGYSSMITLSNNSGYSLILQNSSSDSEIKVVSQITKAFKLN